jgi:hypothetical protein
MNLWEYARCLADRILVDEVSHRELQAANGPEYVIVRERLAHLRRQYERVANKPKGRITL